MRGTLAALHTAKALVINSVVSPIGCEDQHAHKATRAGKFVWGHGGTFSRQRMCCQAALSKHLCT